MIGFRDIIDFVKNPKNTRMIIFGAFILLIILLLGQRNSNKELKRQIEREKLETQRAKNNHEASLDTIRSYRVGERTWRAEKLGYELTIKELKEDYLHLLGQFNLEKNKPPKVVIKTEYLIRDSIVGVPVLLTTDDMGNKSMNFNDSAHYDKSNFRILDGRIPYEISYNEKDSNYTILPGDASINLNIGMNLNLGLFKDKETKKITIKADTDYPGVSFTKLNGANIIDEHKDIARDLRKSWGVGVNFGYGVMMDPSSGGINTGPYIGVGLNYSPKFLQFGK